jgi:hypothetical protein
MLPSLLTILTPALNHANFVTDEVFKSADQFPPQWAFLLEPPRASGLQFEHQQQF